MTDGQKIAENHGGFLTDREVRKLSVDIDAAIAEAVRAERDRCIGWIDAYSTVGDSSEQMIEHIRLEEVPARSVLYQPQQDAANPMFEGGA